ncbi:MAG: glycerate kinase [Oscillatoriales cyanobacterium SM2_2_1]|nr:glycerate kinase [Oscillatoriales cyanobacterium SM2_2_1]
MTQRPPLKAIEAALGFLPDHAEQMLTELWLPLAESLAGRSHPWIQGFVGLQGTGKSTLCRVLEVLLTTMGIGVARLSLDDLYLPYKARQRLQQLDPRLRWRGVPGTHEVALGRSLMGQFRARAVPLFLPRFDKSCHGGAGDRVEAELCPGAEVLLFEGWCVGMMPIPDLADYLPLPPIMTAEDCTFALDMNRALGAYVPLWQELDALTVLAPQDLSWSKQWRREAEAPGGMGLGELDAFVDYFWRAVPPQVHFPRLWQGRQGSIPIDWWVELARNRSPIQITKFLI